MPAPFEEMSTLDRLVHEPARLAILTALAACDAADFLYLQSLTALNKGNLSAHLQKLETAKLITIEKGFRGKVPNTRVEITARGRKSIEHHWKQLKDLQKAASKWKPSFPATLREQPEGA